MPNTKAECQEADMGLLDVSKNHLSTEVLVLVTHEEILDIEVTILNIEQKITEVDEQILGA